MSLVSCYKFWLVQSVSSLVAAGTQEVWREREREREKEKRARTAEKQPELEEEWETDEILQGPLNVPYNPTNICWPASNSEPAKNSQKNSGKTALRVIFT